MVRLRGKITLTIFFDINNSIFFCLFRQEQDSNSTTHKHCFNHTDQKRAEIKKFFVEIFFLSYFILFKFFAIFKIIYEIKKIINNNFLYQFMKISLTKKMSKSI